MYTPVVDTHIEFAEYEPTFETLQARVDAAFSALTDLEADVQVSEADIIKARSVFVGTQNANDVDLSSPGTVVHLKALLSEYDKQVIESASQLRTYITNKLIYETASSDPRIRIKALELLGKISDVGLFTEKAEITLRHRPTEELEQMLRERLSKVVEGELLHIPEPSAIRSETVEEVFNLHAD
jgi:hypothetical protein